MGTKAPFRIKTALRKDASHRRWRTYTYYVYLLCDGGGENLGRAGVGSAADASLLQRLSIRHTECLLEHRPHWSVEMGIDLPCLSAGNLPRI